MELSFSLWSGREAYIVMQREYWENCSFNGLLLFRKGELRIKVDHSKVEVNIAEKGAVELSSNIGAGGRGMELSELRHKTVPFFLL